MTTNRAGPIIRLANVSFFLLAVECARRMYNFALAMLMRQEPRGPDFCAHAIDGYVVCHSFCSVVAHNSSERNDPKYSEEVMQNVRSHNVVAAPN